MGRDFGRTLVQPPAQAGSVTKSYRVVLGCFQSWMETSLGDLSHCWAVLAGKKKSPDIQAEPLISAFSPCLLCSYRAPSEEPGSAFSVSPPKASPPAEQAPLVSQQGLSAPGRAGGFKLLGLVAPVCRWLSRTGDTQNWMWYSRCDLPSAGWRG